MPTLYAAAPWWSGIKHRFISLNHAAAFARFKQYKLKFIWGTSEGVGYCKFQDLFAPVPDVGVINASESELKEIGATCRRSKTMRFRDEQLSVYRPGSQLGDDAIAFDLWGDFAETTALYKQVPLQFRATEILKATPSAELQHQADLFIRRHGLEKRIGIRVRVTENPADGRNLCRIQRELDAAVTSIIQLPWYVRVFIVTDSEYMQQMLASHFPDSKVLPKRFSAVEATGRFIDRKDPAAMRTYVTEIACLTACHNILNYGGFINQESVAGKIIEPSRDNKLLGLRINA